MNIITHTPPLAELWAQAEDLGEITVSRDYQFGVPGEATSRYRVEIKLTTSAGSKFWATGLDRDIGPALAKALTEAQLLGVGDHP